jgi:starch-binding outer membrane protein, SusD/RagB family
MIRYFKRRPAGTALLALTLLAGAGACNFNDRLLSAVDPDIINPTDVNSPDGAEGLRLGVISRLTTMTGAAPANTEGVWFMSGMLTDEWKSGDTFIQRDETDKRTIALDNSIVEAGYRYIHRSRIAANQAIDALRKYPPANAATANAYVAQMQFIRGYAELLSAENFCNGQPFSDGSSGDIVEGEALSVDEAFQRAIVSADSAIGTIGSATDAQSKNVLFAARLVKARALMGLGGAANYASAKAAVAGIPTSYAYNVFFSANTSSNGIWSLNNSARRYVVGDSVDATGLIRNALPFKSAQDPRVPTATRATDKTIATNAFDSNTPFVAQKIWLSEGTPPGREDPIAVVNGIDARLIEAEVTLSQNDPVGWLATLNALRAGPTQISDGLTVSGMTPLVDPGTPEARLSLQFREKAFWTFGRGERLGDLRRLVRQYKRPQDQVFPVGNFFKGGEYGTDVNLPVPQAEENNSLFNGCTDRNA